MSGTSFDTERELTLYTERDLERARRRGRAAGWLQGAALVIAGGFVLKLLGWIPSVLVLGVVGYLLYRLFGRGKESSDPTS